MLCVGDPGPLSPEESERFREDRLRLVWRRDACLVIFLKRDVLFLLRDTTKCAQRFSLSPNTKPGLEDPPVLPLLGLDLLVASRHPGLVARLSGGANLDGRVLKGCGGDGDFGAALGDRLSGLMSCF